MRRAAEMNAAYEMQEPQPHVADGSKMQSTLAPADGGLGMRVSGVRAVDRATLRPVASATAAVLARDARREVDATGERSLGLVSTTVTSVAEESYQAAKLVWSLLFLVAGSIMYHGAVSPDRQPEYFVVGVVCLLVAGAVLVVARRRLPLQLQAAGLSDEAARRRASEILERD